MSRIRFVHAADLHLDSPFVGLGSQAPEHVARTLRAATFEAYANLVDLCIAERVDALLIAGDIFDSADRSLGAQLKFVDGLKNLDQAGIRSFVCHGNHDPLDGWEARLDYPPSCTRFGPQFSAVPIFEDDPGRAVVYGISYPTRAVHDNLVARLGEVDPGPFSIGLLHANVGDNTGHEPYAPCSLEDLRRSGVDYWALGHVHTRQVLIDHSPTAVYPGNSQGRHPAETGARGAYIVEVGDEGDVNLQFRPLDVVRWERPSLEISAIERDQDLIDALHRTVETTLERAEGRPVVVRIELKGRGEAHRILRRQGLIDDLQEELNSEWAGRSPFAWCERIEDGTAASLNRESLLEGSDFLAEVLKTADRARADSELSDRLVKQLDDLYGHTTLRRYLRDQRPEPQDIAEILAGAEEIVADLLQGQEES